MRKIKIIMLLLMVVFTAGWDRQRLTEKACGDGICQIPVNKDTYGGPDWGPTDKIIYNFLDDNKNFQVGIMTPDGSGQECLSCNLPKVENNPHHSTPSVNRHKGGARWHPSGKYIILCAEMDNHYNDDKPEGRTPAMPGRNWWNNLWITDPDGSNWYRLTDYSNTWQVEGAFYPHFSSDGKKLFWAKLYNRTKGEPLGDWQLLLADFVVNNQRKPSIENIRDITPKDLVPNRKFFEPLGFSPDGSKVLFVSNMKETYTWAFDLFQMDIATGEIEDLTKTNDIWNEHARYSPDGKKIIWMSSKGTDYHPEFPRLLPLGYLKTELFIMDADGANVRQLTHFNQPGYPEYSRERSIAGGSSWDKSGKYIIFSRNHGAAGLYEVPKIDLWLLALDNE